ncbi:MAG TPA: hypothetical protein PK597_02485 [Oscillospiraceae bacterium]|nr:hypothetical protein [Oscillospiraceae bacterium]
MEKADVRQKCVILPGGQEFQSGRPVLRRFAVFFRRFPPVKMSDNPKIKNTLLTKPPGMMKAQKENHRQTDKQTKRKV